MYLKKYTHLFFKHQIIWHVTWAKIEKYSIIFYLFFIGKWGRKQSEFLMQIKIPDEKKMADERMAVEEMAGEK